MTNSIGMYAEKVYDFIHILHDLTLQSSLERAPLHIRNQERRLLDEGDLLITKDFSQDPLTSACIEKIQEMLDPSRPVKYFAQISTEQQSMVIKAVSLTKEEYKFGQKLEHIFKNSVFTGSNESDDVPVVNIRLTLSRWNDEYRAFKENLTSFRAQLPKEHPLQDIFRVTPLYIGE